MSVIVYNTEAELFLADAFNELWCCAQAVAKLTPNACMEAAQLKAGNMYFVYHDDGPFKGSLKSICWKPDGEPK